jgi:hypothetical protein
VKDQLPLPRRQEFELEHQTATKKQFAVLQILVEKLLG